MNAEISNIINSVMQVADFYEEKLGDEVFPADRTVSLKNVLLNDLATYSLLLCSVDGSVSDERIKTINYYFRQNLPIGNSDAVNKLISDTKKEYLDNSPIGLKALVTLENGLHQWGVNHEMYISNYYILLFDYVTQDLVTYGHSSVEELSNAEMQFAGNFLDMLREYARANYFDPALITDSTVYSTVDNKAETENTSISDESQSTTSSNDALEIERDAFWESCVDEYEGIKRIVSEIFRNDNLLDDHDDVELEEIADVLWELLDTLTEREKACLAFRYGLHGEALSESELSEKYGVAEERIRQILNKGIRKLRHPSRAKKLRYVIMGEEEEHISQQPLNTVHYFDPTIFEVEGTTLKKYLGNAEHVDIPDGITHIGSQCFYQSKVKSIYFPDSVISMESLPFTYHLKKIDIPANIRTEESGFWKGDFEKITLRSNGILCMENGCLIDTEKQAVIATEKRASFPVHNKIKVIANGAFSEFSSTLIKIPNTVHTIGYGVFGGNDNAIICIPHSVSKIDNQAFKRSKDITIVVDPRNNYYSVQNGFLVETETNAIISPALPLGGILTIPGCFDKIGENFLPSSYYCGPLHYVIVQKGVKEIDSSAFQRHNDEPPLSIIVPRTVSSLGGWVFGKPCTVFCEHNSQPKSWSDYWNPEWNQTTVYWAGEWHYDEYGLPVPNNQL